MPRLTLTTACVAHAADYVLDRQETIRRAVCSKLGYSVDCSEIIGPAVMAAAHRIARGCHPEEHIGWIAAAVARDIDPPRHIADEGTLAEAFAGEPAERQYRPPLRDRIVDGCNHRDPAHRQHAKRAAAHAAGQMELIAPGLWHESETPTEADREHEREAAEWDPARNRPLGMPWGCAVAGGAA